MLADNGRSLEINLVGGCWAIPALDIPGSRESGASAPIEVLRRKSPARIAFSGVDRMVFAGLYALAPNVLDALKIVKPDTVIRWHRAGFRGYWR